MRNVPFVLETSTLAEAAASLVLYAGVFALSDVMLKSNVGQLSVFDLTSGLFTSGTTEIDAGHKSRVPLHSLRFSSESGNGEVLVPWIHPGPIQGFGGFQLPSRIISYLNGNGEDGFMLHAPTTHRSDPAEEGVLEKIRDKSRGTTDLNLASKMVAAETSRFRFYARAYGSSEKESSKKVIFLEPKAGTEIDDYESAIFKKAVNFEDTVVVDLHNNPKAEHGEEVWEGTRTASEIVRGVKRIQSKVEECEMEGYKAGWSAGPDNECFSLVEEVGNQKVLIAGFNGNDLPGDEEIIQEGTREKFDDVLLFTTDSHESVQRLAQHNPYDTGSLRSAVEESEMSIAPTEVGFSYTDIGPVRLLKEDYSALVFSVNILIRFLPVALAAVYLSQLAMIATA
jgi:putative membrane protein